MHTWGQSLLEGVDPRCQWNISEWKVHVRVNKIRPAKALTASLLVIHCIHIKTNKQTIKKLLVGFLSAQNCKQFDKN